jgi:S1-C subfamily serine protease
VAGAIVAHDDNRSTGVPAAVAGSNLRLRGGGLDIQGVLAAVQPAVVAIKTQVESTGPFGGTQSGEAAGSGMVIEPAGVVLTNAHVVAGATSISVHLADGRDEPADLLGSIPSSDVALVHVRGVSNLPVVKLGDSSRLRVGDDLVAVGNALNLGETPTVTKGIVSALNRTIDAENEHLEGLIQTDAAINPGNSGGPLVDADGRVVGVNTAVAGGAQNIGFAIPMNSVKPLIAKLKAGGGDVKGRAAIGISAADVSDVPSEVIQRFGITRTDGAFVASDAPGGGAEKAGIQAGDVIVSVDGSAIRTRDDLTPVLERHQPGDTVQVRYVRNGTEHTVTVTLGSLGVGG